MPSPPITVQVLGAGQDVGRSCMLLTLPPHRILLDCGAHPGHASASLRFPAFSSLPPLDTLDAILISHFHLDHAAALPLLTETLRCRAPVYMTAPTRALAALMLPDFLTTSAARGHPTPYTIDDARAALGRARMLEIGVRTRIALQNGGAEQEEGEEQGKDGVFVTPYYAGHVLGAVMLHVEYNGRSVLYSGDYSTRGDGHLRAAAVPRGLRPELFITEATYCGAARREGRVGQERMVMRAVKAAVEAGGKVLVPVSAFGRVHAVCAMFAAGVMGEVLEDVPMYLVSGLASRANEAYGGFGGWMAGGCGGKWGCGGEQGGAAWGGERFVSRLRRFTRNEHWGLLRGGGPMVLFATPGTMATGVSKDVFGIWAGDERNLVIVPGMSFGNTVAAETGGGSGGGLGVDAGRVKCKMVPMTFGSHADARGLVRTCRKVDARTVMLVHGEKTKILAFRPKLEKALGRPCFAPVNGETVTVPDLLPMPPCGELADVLLPDARLPEEWKDLVRSYVQAMRTQEDAGV